MRLHSGPQRVYRGAAPESNTRGDEDPGACDLHPARLLDGFPESAASDPSVVQRPVMPRGSIRPPQARRQSRPPQADRESGDRQDAPQEVRHLPRIEFGPPKTDKVLARSTSRCSSPRCSPRTGVRSTSSAAPQTTAGRITGSSFRHRSTRRSKNTTSCAGSRGSARAAARRARAPTAWATPMHRS